MASIINSSDKDTWGTPYFREGVVFKIEDAIWKSGSTLSRNSVEIEDVIFSKAKDLDEYKHFLKRLIIHINQIGSNNLAGYRQDQDRQNMTGNQQHEE